MAFLLYRRRRADRGDNRADRLSGRTGRVQRGGVAAGECRRRSSCPARASRTCSPPSTPAPPTTACCRSRTRSAAASTAISICCSSTTCRSSASSKCRSCIICWRCRARTLEQVQADLFASAGAGPVRPLPADAVRRRDHRHLRHRRQRQDDCRRAVAGRGGDRLGAGGAKCSA